MTKLIFSTLGFLVLCALGIFFIFKSCDVNHKLEKDFFSADSTMKSNVGKQVVIKNDTFVIINFSVWNNEYTLNNGIKIDASMVKPDTIVKQHLK